MRYFIFIVFTALIASLTVNNAFSQDRFWVNGSGSWNDPGHWSLVSGGEPGASIPTLEDNVYFDNNSFISDNQFVIIDGKAICKDFNWQIEKVKPSLKSKSFLLKSITKSELIVNGSLFINENLSNDFYGNIELKSNSKETIEVKSTLNSDLVLNANDGSYNLNGDLISNENVIIKAGSLNANKHNIECSEFKSVGSDSKSLNIENAKVYSDVLDLSEDQNLNLIKAEESFVLKQPISKKNVKTGNIDFNTIQYAAAGPAKAVGFSVDITNVTCNGLTNGSVRVYNVTGIADYYYQLWDGPPWLPASNVLEEYGPTTDTEYTFSILGAYPYYIQIIDDESALSQKTEVTEPALLEPGNISVTKDLTCYDGSDAELTANPIGGTAPYNYVWSIYNFGTSSWVEIGQTDPTATGLTQGRYRVVISDFNGCGPVSKTIDYYWGLPLGAGIPDEIVINPDPVDYTDACQGDNNGTITIVASGGTGDLDYSITNNGNAGYQEDGYFTGLSQGTREIWVRDNVGCKKQGQDVTIGLTPRPSANAGAADETCVTKAYTVSDATASDYSGINWTVNVGANGVLTNQTTLTPTYTPGAGDEGTTVTLTLHALGIGNCSEDTDTKDIDIYDIPTANAGGDDDVCVNKAYTVSGASVTNNTSVYWTANAGANGVLTNETTLTPTYTPGVGDEGTTVTLTLHSVGFSNCDEVTDDMLLDIYAAPLGSAGADDETCVDKAYTVSGATASNYGSILWTVNVGANGVLTNETTLTPTYTPGAGDEGTTVTLTMTLVGNSNCDPFVDDMLLDIYAAPTANAGGDGEVCINKVYTVSGASATNYASLYWTANAGANGVLTNETTLTPTYTPGAGDEGTTVTLTLHAVGNSNCDEATDDMLIDIYDAPTGSAGPDDETCIDKAYTVSGATASNYNTIVWTVNAGANGVLTNETTLTPTYTPAAGDEGTTVTLTMTLNGNSNCDPFADDMLLDIYAAPTANAGGDGDVCINKAYTVSGASATNYASVYWTANAGANGAISNGTTLTPTYTPGSGDEGTTVTLTLHAVGNANCDEATDDMLIDVYDAPTGSAGADDETCIDKAYTVSGATASNYSTIVWTVNAGANGILTNANTLTPTYTPGAGDEGTTVTLTMTLNGNSDCDPFADDMLLDIYAAPTANAGGDGDVCINLAYTVSGATATNNASVYWTVNAGANGTLTNGTTLTPTYTPGAGDEGTTVTLTLHAVGNANCDEATDDMLIDIYAAPTANAGGDGDVCINKAYTVSGATATNNASVYWTVNAGANGILTNETTLTPTYTPGAGDEGTTVTLTLHAVGNSNCAEATDDMLIDIYDAPTGNAGADDETCVDKAYTVSGATASNYSTILWTVNAGANGVLTNETTLTPTYTPGAGDEGTTVTLTMTLNGNSDCDPFADDMLLDIYAAPTANAGGPDEICSSDIYTVSGASATNYASVYWTVNAGANGVLTNETTLTPTYTPGAGDENTVVTLTLHAVGNANCDEATDDLLLTIHDTPTAFAGNDANVCYGSSYQINDATTTLSTGVLWTTSGDGTFDADNVINPTYTPGASDLAAGTVTLTLEAFGNPPCTSVTDDMVITIDPELLASIGKPKPYDISATTKIYVSFVVKNRYALHDLSYYLIAPDDTRITLKKATNTLCNFGANADYTFTTEAAWDDTLTICVGTFPPPPPPGLGQSYSDTINATGNWADLYGMDPANGAWRVMVEDCDNSAPGSTDGFLESASIKFIDISDITGLTEIVLYESGTVNLDIYQSIFGGCEETTYAVPIGLTTSCYGTCDASAVGTGSGGTPPYVSYEWSETVDFSTVFSTNSMVDLCAGKYYLRIIDSHGCEAIDSVIVSEPPEIVIDKGDSYDITCNGSDDGKVVLEFSGGTGLLQYSYNGTDWYNSGDTIFNIEPGVHVFTIQDVSGCIKDTTITIDEPGAINVITNYTDISCYGQADATITITVTGGTPGIITPYEYSIDSADTWQTTNAYTNLDEGKYIIIVQDSLGCYGYGDTLYLMNPAPISIDDITVTAITCNGNGSDGTITITATGGTGTLYYSIDGVNYQLSNVFTDLAPNTYSVYVRDDCNTVSAIDAAIVNGIVPVELDIVNITDVSTCYGESTGAIEIIAIGGSGVYQYSNDGGSNYQDPNTFTGLAAGDYTLKVIDDDGCLSKDSIVTVGQPGELLITNLDVTDASECNAITNTGIIVVTATGGTIATTYTYTVTGEASQSSNTFTGLDPGNYTVTVEDDNGCLTTRDTSINLLPAMTISLNAVPISCDGSNDGSITVDITNGILPITSYAWEGPGGFTSSASSISGLEEGTYSVTVTDGNLPTNCVDNASVEIIDPNVSVVSVTIDETEVCWNEPVHINVNYTGIADSVYYQLSERIGGIWQASNYKALAVGNPAIVEHYIRGEARFDVVGVENDYCQKSETVNQNVDYYPSFNLDIIDYDNNPNDDTLEIKGSNQGELTAFVTDETGLTFEWSPILPDWLVNPYSRSTKLYPKDSQEFKVIVTSTDGCIDSSKIYVLYIPAITPNKAFSPNGDGNNDYWNIKDIEKFALNEVVVFNRWGVKVFEQKGYVNEDPNKSWDGKSKGGKDLPSGTYYFIINLNEKGFDPITGPITIVR